MSVEGGPNLATYPQPPLRELAFVFLKLGITGFGGPAAHIGMMEEEVVVRRPWLSREHFLDLVGATSLIPGPNSTEMAIHVGHLMAGWRGMLVSGLAFIMPAAVMTAGFAWLYVQVGALPQIEPYLVGIKPVVLAIILLALLRLGRTALKSWKLVLVGAGVALASLLGTSEILALVVGGLLGALWLAGPPPARLASGAILLSLESADPAKLWTRLGGSLSDRASRMAVHLAALVPTETRSLGEVFLFFLQIGSVLYGSGYVLVAFLEGGLVQNRGWLTETQLLDAIAVGQFTPGPVLTTATFIGFLLAGVPGAGAATLGIFFPSFVFVLLLSRTLPRLREGRMTAAFLDAVNAAAIGLMAAVLLQLGVEILAGWQSWLIAALAALLGFRWKVNAAWLVMGGAITGVLLQ
jgi:chromate transporter